MNMIKIFVGIALCLSLPDIFAIDTYCSQTVSCKSNKCVMVPGNANFAIYQPFADDGTYNFLTASYEQDGENASCMYQEGQSSFVTFYSIQNNLFPDLSVNGNDWWQNQDWVCNKFSNTCPFKSVVAKNKER